MRAEAHKTRGRGRPGRLPRPPGSGPAHHPPQPRRSRLPPRRAAAQRLLPVMRRIAASGELPKVPPFWF